jgi:uncharacterized protein with PQ loop repeat
MPGLHHYHIRKRMQHEPFPHPDKWKRWLDKLVFVAGVFGPIMTIPQILKIWATGNAAGVSAASWIGYLITAIVWFIYGIAHREKPIIVTYAIWILMDAMIILGVALF